MGLFVVFFGLTLTTSCVLRHTFTEKDNVLTWTKTKEKKNIYLKWGKNCKKKKKKQKTEIERTTKNE